MKPNLAEDIISVSDFRKKTSSYLQEIRSKKRMIVLTQNGHSAAVVIDPETFERMRYERELFAAIARGEKDLEEGRVIPHEKVMKDLLKMIKSLQK